MAVGDFTGKKPKDTFDSILHVEDNDTVGISLQYITDGKGNATSIRVSNSAVELTNTTLLGTLTLGSPLPMASGGFGVVLVDPNADRLLFWDDSAGQYQFLTVGTNLSITGTTINGAIGAGVPWVEVVGTTQAAAVNTGYLLNNASRVHVSLPTTVAVGEIIRISGVGAGGWRVTQSAGQQIHFGDMDTTSGTGGYTESVHRRDSIELLCCVANTEFNVISSQGNITIV